MNNNYDPNQQPQNDEQDVQTQYQDSEQQPEEKKSIAPDRLCLILSIVGIALGLIACIPAGPLAGLIVSIVAMLKTKKYFDEGGECIGEAKIAKILAIVGIALGALSCIGQIITFAMSGIGFIVSIFSNM